MRTVLIGLAVAAIIFAVTGGHIFFLPLLFIPLGLSALRQRQRQRLTQLVRSSVRSRS